MADLIQIGIDVNTNIKQATADLDKMGGSVVNNIRTIDRLESEVKQLNNALSKGTATEAAYAKGMRQINNELSVFQQRAAKAAQIEKRFGAAAASGGKSMNRFNVAVQQGGFQLQDFVVQLQAGTSFFTAFGQQGSQFAGIFGPKGAMLGAVIALGSAFGGMAAKSHMASRSVKDFGEQLEETSSVMEDYISLASKADDVFADLFESSTAALNQTSQAAKDLLLIAKTDALDSIRGLGKSLSDTSTEAGFWAKVMLNTDRTVTGNLLNIDTQLKGNITAWKNTGKEVQAFIDQVRNIGKADSIDGMYQSALKARDIFKQTVDVTGEMTEKQKAFWKELSTTILKLEVMGAANKAAMVDMDMSAFGGDGPDIKKLTEAREKAEDAIAKIRRENGIAYFKNEQSVQNDIHQVWVKNNAEQNKKRLSDIEDAKKSRRDAGIAYFKNEQANETEIHNQRIKNIIAELKAKTEAEAVAVSVRRAAGEAYFRQEDKIQAQILNATVDKIMEEYEAKVEANQNAADLRRAAGEAYFRDQQELEASIHQVRVDNILNEAALREATIDAARAKFNANAGSIAVGEGAAEATAAYNLKKRVEELQKAWRDLGKETKNLKKGMTDAERAAEALRKELEAPMVKAIDSVSNAFGDFIADGLKDFKSFASSIVGSFKSMISQMIATAARNKIMLSMGMGGTAFADAATAGNVAGVGGNAAFGPIGSFMGSFAGGGAAGSGLLGGIGSVFGANGIGLGGSFGSLGTMLSGGSTVAAGGAGFASTLGAAIPAIAAVAVVVGLLSKKTKLLDSGLRTTVEGFDIAIDTFKTTQSSRLFGLLKSRAKTGYEAASAEVADPVIEAIGNMQQSIIDAAGTLGIGANAFDDFSYQFKLSLKGLTEEEQLQKINEEITKMGDSFASLTGHFETMNELLEAANQRMELQNRLDQLLGNNQAILTRQREAELSAMHELNRPLAQAIYDLEDAQAAVQGAFAALRASIDKVVSDLQKKLSVANEAVNRSRSIVNQLESALSGRSLTQGVGQSFSRREGAMSFLSGGDFSDENKLKEALDVVAEPSEDLFGSFVDYARDFARTSLTLEETKKVAQVQLTADEQQVLLLEQQIASAEAQYQTQVDQYNALLGIDTSVKSVASAMTDLRSAITNLKTTQERVATQQTISGAQQTTTQTSATNLTRIGTYNPQTALGGSLLAESNFGKDYYKIRGAEQLLAAANSLGIQTSSKSGTEIQKLIAKATNSVVNMDTKTRAQQFAMGGYHTGGLRMVGERGPELEATGPSRIFSHNQTASMFKDPELVSEVRNLRSEVSGLRSEQRQMQASNVKYVKRNYDINRKWDTDGLPATRTS